ncbi:MAG: NADPH-dependent assimilatory sulfite reductase hemoprotein subunit [Dehalococcoidia bacterium]
MTLAPPPEGATSRPERPPSKNETLKAGSDGLAGTLFEEIADESSPRISEDAVQLLKFHGSYMQDDRDERKERRAAGGDRAWQFMVRTKFPGGRMTAEQYLLADELASTLANGTLRITTRQDFQFHGVGKSNLKQLIHDLNERWVTTYGGCGDIARNVLTCPVADLLPGAAYDYQTLAQQVSDRFLADSTAYYELWLDGEKILADGTRVKVQRQREETLYGPTYMPRKHKMSIGLPHDNCIDLFTHDLALEAIIDGHSTLLGFNLVAGGGLGTTHGMKATIPRLGDRIGFLSPEQAIPVLEAATAVYRDYGDRSNRRHARLKYVLEDRGVEWFRDEVNARLDEPLGPVAEAPAYAMDDHLGWHKQADGRWLVGIWVENGRVKDEPELPAKAGLRAIVEAVQPEVRLTAQQNIVLANIEPSVKRKVTSLLRRYGLSTGNGVLSTLRRNSMACPALPTCGLAVAESERYLPDVLTELEERGYADDRVSIRMSGCPNSCSRPPTAEIGIIGRSLGLYEIHLGGNFEGTRLSRLHQPDVRAEALVDTLAGMLGQWKAGRNDGEAFGDWAARALTKT